ncbi:MAG: hypothetical protein QM496_07890, partial [Verrucomicrobiota bacterium]
MLSAKQNTGSKVCGVCGFENSVVAFLCQQCTNDLTFTTVKFPSQVSRSSAAAEVKEVPRRQCENGHELRQGDLLCLDCGAAAVVEKEGSPSQGGDSERVFTCGELRVELPEQAVEHEFFTVEIGNQRVRVFPQGLEPDATLQDRLMQVQSEFVATLRSRGRVEEDRSRYFEVWENS